MISDMTKANILIAIAEGQSVAEAAKPYGLRYAQARGALSRFCPHLKLRWDIEEIRTNPKRYIDAALAIVASIKNALRRVLRNDLVFQLKLRSADEHKLNRYVRRIR